MEKTNDSMLISTVFFSAKNSLKHILSVVCVGGVSTDSTQAAKDARGRYTVNYSHLAVRGNPSSYLWAELPFVSDRRKHFHWDGKRFLTGKALMTSQRLRPFQTMQSESTVVKHRLVPSFSSQLLLLLCILLLLLSITVCIIELFLMYNLYYWFIDS